MRRGGLLRQHGRRSTGNGLQEDGGHRGGRLRPRGPGLCGYQYYFVEVSDMFCFFAEDIVVYGKVNGIKIRLACTLEDFKGPRSHTRSGANPITLILA